ncbi:caprin-2 isoform X2 [Petaurus breviceps papuanus]|uniref:caprin-2 isoform X2 n=1 Tax=Petaurus breviceps papuanus TaxID=3040969 RepID=UPI0036DD5948
MVLLSSFSLCSHLPSGHSEESKVGNMKSAKQQVNHGQSGESQPPLSPLRSALNSVVTSSQAYETYIDNGLICLKHKIRNIEKKKLKLEDYKDRLKNGEPLNSDQLEAVEKYDEVLHNLEFAKELQKTFSALSQDLLKAQKKAQRREHMIKLEAEKRKLRTIFQVQYVLQNFTQEHVQEDFKGGLNGAVYLPSRELDYLIKFSKLTCPERNESLSIEDQMEQSSLYFWDLLEGSEKAVAGTTYHCIAEKSKVYQSWSSHSVAVTVYILVLLTSFSISSYKHMKDLLSKLLTSGYFESIPVPRNNIIKQKEDLDEEIREKSRKKQSLQTELVKESESLMEHIQPEIQPQEFLNRRYLSEVEYSSKKPEGQQSWEEDFTGKPNLKKCWEVITDLEGQKKLESLMSWDSVKQQAIVKPVLTPKQDNQESLESTTVDLQEEQKTQEISKSNIVHGTWEQDIPKSNAVCVQEEQKKKESLKPWVAPLQKELEPKKQTPKSWTPSAQNEQKAIRSWPTSVHEEQDTKPPEIPEPWEARVENQKQSLLQQLQSPSKSWGPPAASLVMNGQLMTKKYDSESKDVPKLLNQSADTPTAPPNDSVLRKEKLQDLMSQIQGTYNFMQESVLDFDKPSSAIPSPQLPSVIPDSPEASIDQKLPNQNDFLQEPLQAATSPVKHSTNSLVIADQTSSESETELETPQAAIPPSKQLTSLPSANLPMSQASQEQVFQSPPASSSTVFNVNAPLPSRKEQETKDSPYSSGYNQSYTTASTQTAPQCQLPSTHVEQATLSQEQTANSQLDGTIQVSSGSLAFYPAQTNVFPRSTQSYLSNRGSIRGCTRGGRLLTNSFRSPGGYKGFDTYRGSPVIANGSYGHLQFQVREYSGTPYSQRDTNFQQCYKRGGLSSGSRTSSRGWSDSSQVNSPERENETFNSVDSGQGDSRSMTPVDVPVTSPAATILPVHVYPLPQQMRVAFSAARTSNLAPGTLDQPIVFDLLLNNLGETFDLQLGRFNCPVNGTYVFIFHMLKLAVNVPLYVNLMKNEEVLVSAYANDGAPDHETASNHAILQLFQGDQIWLRLHRGAIYGSSWKYSTFSGYLLYQD